MKFYNPEKIIFQHKSFKEQVLKDSKDRWEEVNCFRNGYIRQHLTSVDTEEVDRVGGVITEFLEGYIYDNLDYDPFKNFVVDMRAKRNKYKKNKKKHITNPS